MAKRMSVGGTKYIGGEDASVWFKHKDPKTWTAEVGNSHYTLARYTRGVMEQFDKTGWYLSGGGYLNVWCHKEIVEAVVEANRLIRFIVEQNLERQRSGDPIAMSIGSNLSDFPEGRGHEAPTRVAPAPDNSKTDPGSSRPSEPSLPSVLTEEEKRAQLPPKDDDDEVEDAAWLSGIIREVLTEEPVEPSVAPVRLAPDPAAGRLGKNYNRTQEMPDQRTQPVRRVQPQTPAVEQRPPVRLAPHPIDVRPTVAPSPTSQPVSFTPNRPGRPASLRPNGTPPVRPDVPVVEQRPAVPARPVPVPVRPVHPAPLPVPAAKPRPAVPPRPAPVTAVKPATPVLPAAKPPAGRPVPKPAPPRLWKPPKPDVRHVCLHPVPATWNGDEGRWDLEEHAPGMMCPPCREAARVRHHIKVMEEIATGYAPESDLADLGLNDSEAPHWIIELDGRRWVSIGSAGTPLGVLRSRLEEVELTGYAATCGISEVRLAEMFTSRHGLKVLFGPYHGSQIGEIARRAWRGGSRTAIRKAVKEFDADFRENFQPRPAVAYLCGHPIPQGTEETAGVFTGISDLACPACRRAALMRLDAALMEEIATGYAPESDLELLKVETRPAWMVSMAGRTGILRSGSGQPVDLVADVISQWPETRAAVLEGSSLENLAERLAFRHRVRVLAGPFPVWVRNEVMRSSQQRRFVQMARDFLNKALEKDRDDRAVKEQPADERRCEQKLAFLSMPIAQGHARMLDAAAGFGMVVSYECDVCGEWHNAAPEGFRWSDLTHEQNVAMRQAIWKPADSRLCMKKTFRSQAAAEAFGERVDAKYGFGKTRAYQCEVCAQWHNTSMPEKKRK